MDRNKVPLSSSRAPKKVSSHASSEFFALGSKGYNRGDETKAKLPISKASTSTAVDRKRDATGAASSSLMAAKKPKLSSSVRSAEGAGAGIVAPSNELWEQMATDCDSVDIIETIQTAAEQHDNETLVRLICGCIKNIISSYAKSKPDMIAMLSIMYLAKVHPDYFNNDIITSGLLHILRRDFNLKMRQSSYSHVLACNLLMRVYADKRQWPEIFMRIYIDDAINDRFWSDNSLCAPFIKNIAAAFKTRQPQLTFLQSDGSASGAGTPTMTTPTAGGGNQQNLAINVDDDSCDNSEASGSAKPSEFKLSGGDTYFDAKNRYVDSERIVEKYVTEAIKEQLNKRQQQECYTRNFLKFLCITSGLVEVRHLCISRLELWIHNGKLVKFAQELLSYICFNVRAKHVKDHEVLAILVKMRLKAKPLINFYMACIKEMIRLEPGILNVVLKLVVQNELSNTRNPNNMGMLATMFQTAPDESAKCLAEIYKEFLLQREDCLRTLRVFLRELVRMLRNDINLVVFCKVFLNGRPELNKQIENSEFRDRIFHSMVDIACLCMLLSVSPQVREASISLRVTKDNAANNAILLKFYNQMCQIQLDCVSWMYEIVPALKLQGTEYYNGLHKMLLLDNAEQYSRYDQWPSEPERTTLLRLVSETPIHEDTLIRIILIGITKEIPFTIPDTFDIIISLIKRASTMRITSCPVVQANKFDIIDFLFNMAEYHHPENINLPVDYEPPKLAITVLYWKAWLIMLMISAHNPSTFGAFCWNHYPTMKMLMEMCITNQFNESTMTKEELQIIPMERDHIVEFESYLAAQTSQAVITEENAILTSQLMLMDPMGVARRLPAGVLEQLRSLNKLLKIGHLLCRSRKPDLLLDIIQRQGTSQSMPWLSDLVQNSDGDFNHLPVQCLCEFLLFNASVINEENSRDAELVNFLRNVIMDPAYSKQTCEILDYIFRRLCSTVKTTRVSALRGLKIIFKSSDMSGNDWLLSSIPQIPHFNEVRVFIIPQLRSACQVENCPDLVMAYIQFIAANTLDDSVTDMLDHVIDMAQLIVERSTMFQHIIPLTDGSNETLLFDEQTRMDEENRLQTLKCLFVMFNNYIIKLRDHHETYQWNEYPDLLMVQFNDGVQLPLHLNIIHAFIILLTHSSNQMPESVPILDYWFPVDGNVPIAYIPNMPQEPVQLLPDWLKLKMIRSSVDRLIEAAIRELTPDQIVLFVQNFGTPINSMSKLLALLDHAVIEQFDTVKNAILNKAYLAQLIEIQQARGAKNGHYTVNALGLYSHSQTVEDNPKIKIDVLEPIGLEELEMPSVVGEQQPEHSHGGEENLYRVINWSQRQQFQNADFHALIHYLLELDGKKDAVITQQILGHKNLENLLLNVLDGNQAVSLFRSLLRLCPISAASASNNLPLFKTLTTKFEPIFFAETMQKLIASTLEVTPTRESNTTLVKPTRFTLQQVLGEFRNERKSLKPSKFYSNGMLVDLLADNDPELCCDFLKEDLPLLFSQRSGDFRFYMLSWICHETNWNTLIHSLEYMLRSANNEAEDLDYSTVLNFIEALIHNPKLWQGRDRTVLKTDLTDNVINLVDGELKTFTEFILKEGEMEFKSSASQYPFILSCRINLLFRICRKNTRNLIRFIEHVCQSTKSPEKLRLSVLRQMYLMYPSIKFIRSQQIESYADKLQNLNGCQADKVTSNLITCLGNLLTKKDFEALSSDIELLIRKIAASHPALFLRQLGVLSSLIQGLGQLSLRVIRDEYHMHRFIQILRTLELLQPTCFDDIYKEEFQSALKCYFTFFQQYSNVKEAYHILIKLIELLQAYINVNPSSALAFIEQHEYVDVLMDLASRYNSISSLHQLVQGITLLQQKTTSSHNSNVEVKQEFDFEESSYSNNDNRASTSNSATTTTSAVVAAPMETDSTDSSGSYQLSNLDINSRGAVTVAISGSLNKSTSISPHFANLIKIVKHSTAEDTILGPLQEIESFTSKRFNFLSELFDRLLELIFSSSAQIRSNAFILLIRHLKHNPGRTDVNRCTLNAYIQCLRDDNSSVAATAMDNLTDMCLLLQEHAREILSVSFALGLKSKLNTSPQIKRALQTIMLQHGY
ncbi:integrator complex subunit 1 [Musca domestica]|uniref:Integrator complex subunit 1 n=1 Tax=Musca domestica TaxID=7370 RepID=A0A1I8MCI0_MUSDO|nr:integrator complex subunit 1 [Musca domestica]